MADRPQERIQVMGPGDRERKATRHCRLDNEIRLDHDRIQASFPRLLTRIDLDLLTLAGAVGYADRTVRRRRSTGWGRDISLSVPVSDVDFWAANSVVSQLAHCLSLLTGDTWCFDFTALKRPRPLQPSLQCDPEPFEGVACAIPYSGGLDSLAGLQIWQANNPSRAALRIGTETNKDVGDIIRRSTEGWESAERVCVRLGLSAGAHPEPTYRTRTFIFFITAALAAKLAGVSQVLVMENGQGGLGPSLVPMGDEWPYRSTHPMFTQTLRELLLLVWEGDAPEFAHPHVWSTKGDVLRRAAQVGDRTAWQETRSCSRNPRRTKGASVPRSCGLCGGCLLRRASLVAAGLEEIERKERYVWKNLGATSLRKSGRVTVSEGDRTIALTNILDLRYLAEVPTDPAGPAVRRVADEIGSALGMAPKEAVGRVRRLVEQHREDWIGYLDHLGPKSWVGELGRPQ